MLSRNREEELNYVYVRDIEVGTSRTSFLGLVKDPEIDHERVNTIFDVEAQVDIDEEGEIIGVSLLWDPS